MSARMLPRLTVALVALTLLTGLAACGGGGGGTDPKPTAESLTREGWTAFEAADYVTAAARFADAVALTDTYADAYVGLGWVELRARDYVAAQARFDEALARNAQALDARAGLVLVSVGRAEASAVRTRGAAVLEANNAYVFAHDRTYAASDIRWFMARAALEQGDYAAVVTQLDVLAPGHGLVPESLAFVEAAAALLETLSGTV